MGWISGEPDSFGDAKGPEVGSLRDETKRSSEKMSERMADFESTVVDGETWRGDGSGGTMPLCGMERWESGE